MIEPLKTYLPARIKAVAWIQTQRKMLIEFRGSRRWNHQWVNSISFTTKQIFAASSWEFYRLHLCPVRCVYLFIKVRVVVVVGGGSKFLSDFRLQQLAASRCRTRGADPIKNEWDQAQLQVLCQVLMHPHRVFGCQHAPQLAQQRGD